MSSSKNASNDIHGDIDALSMIQEMPGDDLLKRFLKEIFNHELDKGENATFAYRDVYRKIVETVVSRQESGR